VNKNFDNIKMLGRNVKKIWQLFPLPHCGGVSDLPSVAKC